jgi:eukaryotic-like serine/threonine-protein kinase
MTLALGTRLGPYEILSPPLGDDRGGMAVVYRARDLRLGREVAIKIPRDHLAGDPDALARFEREARAIAALWHRNILDIHDVGNESGVPYIVTELLPGESLGARIRRGPLPWRDAVDIGISIAEGLSAAHGCGVVHRDLKPDNVFLLPDGHVKILDFGLAKREKREARPAGEDGTAFSTESDVLLGTAGYISPEQVSRKPADEKSDIFAVGCILYEMVTGRRAFTGETSTEALFAALKQEPRDPADFAEMPEDVRMIILRCLAKKPESRFLTAADLAFAV